MTTNEEIAEQKILQLPAAPNWPGPYLRLEPLALDRLPQHPDLSQDNPTKATEGETPRPDLRAFVLQLFSEALHLAKDQVPGWLKVPTILAKSASSFPGVNTQIKSFTLELSGNDIKFSNSRTAKNNVHNWENYPISSERWFARQSLHKDAVEPGTASWEEFVSGLRDNHSENEMDYTGDVYDARLILDYAQQLREAGLTSEIDGLTLRIFEMAHHIAAGTNRVFATLVLTGSVSPTQFIVAQFPVELKGFAGAYYSEERNRGKDAQHSNSKMKKKVIIGAYTSVEYCERQVNEQTKESETLWVMATSSDAKGWILPTLQHLAIPGVIAKDVKFFIDWSARKRS